MNCAETLQVLEKLAIVGATHFKSDDFEVRLSGSDTTAVVQPKPDATSVIPPEAPLPSHNAENTRKIQELMDLLKSKDEEILNKWVWHGLAS